MPSWSTFAVFVPAALLLLVVPGPAVVYIVTRSVDQGRPAGIASVLGVTTGSVAHVFAAALGVSLVLARSAEVFTVMKLAGAAYLVVLGVRRLLTGPSGDVIAAARDHSLRRLYGQGVVVQTLNPKVAIFFLAFLPQFVDTDQGSVALQVAVLGLLFATIALASDALYAVLADLLAGRIRRSGTGARIRRYVSGGIFIALGASAAAARRAS